MMAAAECPIDELLLELDEELERVGHPLARFREPGLEDGRIDELVGSLGLVLPNEARALWRWRASTDSAVASRETSATALPGGLELPPLERCVSSYEMSADAMFFELSEADPSWFPGFRFASVDYWFATDVAADAPVLVTPLSFRDPEGWDDVRSRQCGSVSEIVEQMAEMLRVGHWVREMDQYLGPCWGFPLSFSKSAPWEQYPWVLR
jgi:hypothetical protein